ncbi:MAG: hypothetical protein JNN15_15405 [Blastocatellia bacterium]|nr:hypothetical protein [Blastocatellia bacterium]
MEKSKKELEKSLEDSYRKLFKELSFLICLDQESSANVILIAASILWGQEGVEEEIDRAREEIKRLLAKIDKESKEFYSSKAETNVENDWNLFEDVLNRL